MVAKIASLFFRDPIKLYERLCKYVYLYSFLAFMRTEFIWLAHIYIAELQSDTYGPYQLSRLYNMGTIIIIFKSMKVIWAIFTGLDPYYPH